VGRSTADVLVCEPLSLRWSIVDVESVGGVDWGVVLIRGERIGTVG
jgi:hypothetical protein